MPGADISRTARTGATARPDPRFLVIRISDIFLPDEFERESRREELRDQRWQRHRSMLQAVSFLIGGLALYVHPQPVLVLLRWL